ncbi:MAG: hypothetical protein AB7D02_01080 [Candidatus Paceibacterota bacterium]
MKTTRIFLAGVLMLVLIGSICSLVEAEGLKIEKIKEDQWRIELDTKIIIVKVLNYNSVFLKEAIVPAIVLVIEKDKITGKILEKYIAKLCIINWEE